MTGLNLESFLHLLRADFGAWVTLGLIAVVLALMAWTSWGSRRALRKCLVLSVVAHFGLALYGGTVPVTLFGIRPDTLLGVIGMENGDRLEKINGFDMGSPETALEAYARLRTADHLTVTVNRRGQTQNLDFNIK